MRSFCAPRIRWHTLARIGVQDMLKEDDIKAIQMAVDNYWSQELEVHNRHFYDIATGKEPGHQLGDKVDQLSTSLICANYPRESGFQHKDGKICTRSMGDIWFKNSAEEWNPINVKTGLVGSEGQPNIVSLKRVMSSIIDRTIDAYYLLMVKFEVDRKRKIIKHNVYLTDILNWLELPNGESVVTFNSGPGQTMLKAKRFYELLAQGVSPKVQSVQRKMELLMELYLEGERNLMRDRERDRKIFEDEYNRFMQDRRPFLIDKIKQREYEISL